MYLYTRRESMKKNFVFITFLIIIMVVGCSKKEVFHENYTFVGENHDWKAKCTAKETVTFTEHNNKTEATNNSDNKLTITYKGKLSNLSSVKHIKISYKTDLSEGFYDGRLDEGVTSKTYIFTSVGQITDENDIIKVTIELDEKRTTFNLVSKKKN